MNRGELFKRPILIEIRRHRGRKLLWSAFQAPGTDLDFGHVRSLIRGRYRVTWTGFGPRGGNHLIQAMNFDGDVDPNIMRVDL